MATRAFLSPSAGKVCGTSTGDGLGRLLGASFSIAPSRPPNRPPTTGANGRVVAIDISDGMVEMTAKRCADAGLAHVETAAGDAARLDRVADAAFDVASVGQVLEYMTDPMAAVTETARVLGAGPLRLVLTVFRELRFGLGAAVVAGFGRVIAEVGSALMVGGNIEGVTRTMTTAIALETSKGEFAQGIALGIVMIALALLVNVVLAWLQGAGTFRHRAA